MKEIGIEVGAIIYIHLYDEYNIMIEGEEKNNFVFDIK